jgi:peptidoglycan/LPS O-acetylase OafA/YrhL
VVEYLYTDKKLFGSKGIAHWIFYIFPGFRLLEFIVGMIIYDRWKNGAFSSIKFSWLAIPILLIAMYFGNIIPEPFRFSLFYLPFVSFLLVSNLTNKKSFVHIFFTSRFMVFLGEASFAFYLIHQPIIRLTNKFFAQLISNQFFYFIILLLFITLISVLVFLIIEKPIRKILKNKILH